MAKSKKKHKPNRPQQNRKPSENRPERAGKDTPNSGVNRAQKRAQAQGGYSPRKSPKPTWLRVLIIAVMVVMLLAVILPPLLQ